MNNKKGVTLASLTVYVIVLLVILVILTFISANFTSQISEVTSRGKISNESIKLYSFMISDIKTADSVVEYSDNYLRLDNDIKYSIKYIDNKISGKREYEIYRNDVLISEDILNASFDYNSENNSISLNLKYIYGKAIVEKAQTFLVGRGY